MTKTISLFYQNIRDAVNERDDMYKLKDIIEFVGASFGKRSTANQASFYNSDFKFHLAKLKA